MRICPDFRLRTENQGAEPLSVPAGPKLRNCCGRPQENCKVRGLARFSDQGGPIRWDPPAENTGLSPSASTLQFSCGRPNMALKIKVGLSKKLGLPDYWRGPSAAKPLCEPNARNASPGVEEPARGQPSVKLGLERLRVCFGQAALSLGRRRWPRTRKATRRTDARAQNSVSWRTTPA
jgi:hypothetical protein